MTKLIFLAAEDWSFLAHRMPMARAARDAGFDVAVITRVNRAETCAAIESGGIRVIPFNWQRRSINLIAALREISAIRKIYAAERPNIVHHVAIKPIIWGTLAAIGAGMKRVVNAPTGLGYIFTSQDFLARGLRVIVSPLLRFCMRSPRVWTVLENSDDLRDLIADGMIIADRATLIRGCGIELDIHTTLLEPDGPITIGIAARMLHDKGIMPLVQAIQMVRQRGLDIRLLMAGTPDAENHASLTDAEMAQISAMPGITVLGQIADIRALWARCHIAVLPSRREGLPKALLEAAAAQRAIIATDVPGCREICVDGVNGIRVPVDDARALADAIQVLAQNPALRACYAAASRAMAEGDLSAIAVGAAMTALYNRIVGTGK